MSKKRTQKQIQQRSSTPDSQTAALTSFQWKNIVRSPWFIPLISIFILIILLSLRLIIDLDLGFHLRGGEWMLEHRAFHGFDVFTYTVNNHEYIAMYWLYQIVLFLTYQFSGYAGISLMNSLFLIILFYLIFLHMKNHNVRPALIVIILLPAVISMEIRFGVRPEIMTWIAMLSMLIVLDKYFQKKHRYLYLLPLIQLLWSNLHGLFIIGWFLVGAYFISQYFHKRKFDKKFFWWSTCAILISLINPYFIKGVLFPFYLFTRLQGSNIFKAAITELTSPWSAKAIANMPKAPLFIYYGLSLITLLTLIFTWRKRKLHEFLILPAFFYISFTAVRNVPILIIAALPVVGIGVDYLAVKIKQLMRIKTAKLAKINLIGAAAFTVMIVLISMRIITNAFYTGRRGGNFGIGIDEKMHPVAAAEFMNNNDLTARFINDLNRGSWLIWATKQPVFIDGRLEVIQEDFFRKYQKSFQRNGLPDMIYEYKPSLIIYDYSYPEAMMWEIQLQQMPEWRKIYWDETSVIYALDNYRPDLTPVNFMSIVSALGIDTTISSEQIWRSLQQADRPRFATWLQGFYQHKYFPADLGRMAYYASINLEFRAAELLYYEFLQKTDQNHYAAYIGLGTIYMLTDQLDRSIYCYERALKQNPKSEIAVRRIKKIKEYLGKKPLLYK